MIKKWINLQSFPSLFFTDGSVKKMVKKKEGKVEKKRGVIMVSTTYLKWNHSVIVLDLRNNLSPPFLTHSFLSCVIIDRMWPNSSISLFEYGFVDVSQSFIVPHKADVGSEVFKQPTSGTSNDCFAKKFCWQISSLERLGNIREGPEEIPSWPLTYHDSKLNIFRWWK